MGVWGCCALLVFLLHIRLPRYYGFKIGGFVGRRASKWAGHRLIHGRSSFIRDGSNQVHTETYADEELGPFAHPHGEVMRTVKQLVAHPPPSNTGALLATLKALLRDQRYGGYGGSGTEMQGRKFGDVAFSLALAGVEDQEIFDMLTDCMAAELERFGGRKSRTNVDLLQVVERLAAAGMQGHRIFHLAQQVLDRQNMSINVESMELFSTRPRLWLWRHASRLDKSGLQADDDDGAGIGIGQTAGPSSQASSIANIFTDPRLPLIVDLGCGSGGALLGMAYHSGVSGQQQMNVLGVDMSSRVLRYAQAISRRWKMTGRCQFVECCSDAALAELAISYPGPVAMVMINFPTPFKAGEQDKAGNRQLPNIDQFLVRPALLSAIDALQPSLLLLQTNVEDVAIYMRDMISNHSHTLNQKAFQKPHLAELQHRMQALFGTPSEVLRWKSAEELDQFPLSQRDAAWRDAHNDKRAAGAGFLSSSPLPWYASTETEAACAFQRKPVHRLIYTHRSHAGRLFN